MASYNKFRSFVEALAEKTHNLQSDTLTVALTNTVPVNTNTVLANISQISYTNLSSRVLTVSSSAQTAGVYKLVIADLILTASGTVPAFRYVVIYNDSATNDELIGWYDIGSEVNLLDTDTLTLDFDGTDGVIQIT